MGAESPDWLGADKAKRAETFRGYKEKFGGVFDKDQKNLQADVYDALVTAEYVTGVIAAADPSIKAFPVSGLLKIAFNEAFSSDLPKAKKLMFDCLDYLESAAENQGDGQNINFVDVSEGVEVYKDTGDRWKLRVGPLDGDKKITTARIDRFLFPKKEDVVADATVAPAPAPVTPELTPEQQAKITEYKNDVLQKLKLIFGDDVNSLDQEITFEELNFKYENNLSDADWLSNEQYFRISAAYKGSAIRLFIAPYGSSPVYKPDDTDPEKDGEELADLDAIKQYISAKKTDIDAAPTAPADEFTYALPSDNTLQATQAGQTPETFNITKDADIKLAPITNGTDNYIQVTADIGGTKYDGFFEFGSNYTDLKSDGFIGTSNIWEKYSIELSGKEIIIKAKTAPDVTPPAPIVEPPAPAPAPVEPELSTEDAQIVANSKARALARLKEVFGDSVISLDQTIAFEGLNFKYENNFTNQDWLPGGSSSKNLQISAAYNGGHIVLYMMPDTHAILDEDGNCLMDTDAVSTDKLKQFVVDRKKAIDEAVVEIKPRQEWVLNKLREFFGAKTLNDVITIEGLPFRLFGGVQDVEVWRDADVVIEAIYKGEQIYFFVGEADPHEINFDGNVYADKAAVIACVKAEKEKIDKWESTDVPARMAGVTAKIVELGGTDLKSPLIINGLLFTPPVEGSVNVIDTLGAWMEEVGPEIFWFTSSEGIMFGINLKPPHGFVEPGRSKIEPNDKTCVENYVKAEQRRIGVKKVLKSLGVDIDSARIHWSMQLADLEFRPMSFNGGLANDKDWSTDGNKFLMIADYKGVQLDFGVTVAGTYDLVNTNGEKFPNAVALEAYIQRRKDAVDAWEREELPKFRETVLQGAKELGAEKLGDPITIEDIRFDSVGGNGGLVTTGDWMRTVGVDTIHYYYQFYGVYGNHRIWIGVSPARTGGFALYSELPRDSGGANKWSWLECGASQLKTQVADLKKEIDNKEKPAEAAK